MKHAGMCKLRGSDGRSVWVSREALAQAQQIAHVNTQDTIELQNVSGATADSLMACVNHIRQRQDCPEALNAYLAHLSLHRLLELWHFAKQCGVDYVQQHVMHALTNPIYAWQFFAQYHQDRRLYQLCSSLDPQPYDIFISAIFSGADQQTAHQNDTHFVGAQAYTIEHLVVDAPKRISVARCSDGKIRIFDVAAGTMLYAIADHVRV